MFEQTDTEWGVWTIIEATDRNFTRIKILQTLIAALEERLQGLNAMPAALFQKPKSKALAGSASGKEVEIAEKFIDEHNDSGETEAE